MEEEIKVIRDNLKSALKEIRGRQRDDTRRGIYGWWDRECKGNKKEVSKMLRECTSGKRGGEKYRKRKKEYKNKLEFFRQ